MIFKRFLLVFLMIVVVITAGVFGYHIIEGWSLLDSLYMTAITLSTVGYKEIAELSVGGKWFTIALIGGGVLTVTVAFGMFTKLMLEGELAYYLRRRKMEKRIKSLKGHIIVCGIGELGEEVIRNLHESDEEFVVIDISEEEIHKLKRSLGDFEYIQDDAREIETLKGANIDEARTLISCLGSDSENLFVVITARDINPSLTIVTENIDPNVREKLRRAGADYIIAPSQIGGRRMACVATQPAVVSFLDIITAGGGKELQLESVPVKEGASVESQTLAQAQIPSRTGLVVISIRKKKTNQFIYNPSSHTVLEPGDEIIVLGQRENLSKLKSYIS